MIRTIAIWVFGLLGSGIAGNLIGGALAYDGGIEGFFAGAFGFACLRLWLTTSPQTPHSETSDDAEVTTK